METIVESSAASAASLFGTGGLSSLGEALKLIEIHVYDGNVKKNLIKITRSAYGGVVKDNDIKRFSAMFEDAKASISPQSMIITRLLLNAYTADNSLADTNFPTAAEQMLQ